MRICCRRIQVMLLLFCAVIPSGICADELFEAYQRSCSTPWNINEHVPVLRELAKQSSSAVEIGMDVMVSTWGILQGLSESTSSSQRSYLGIDIARPPQDTLHNAKRIAGEHGISFEFWHANDMDVDIPTVDLLFIDSLHTYCHLTYELEKFSPHVNMYIALHDTSPPWGYVDEEIADKTHSAYPSFIDKTKQGLWPAVEDFLQRHPEWMLIERRLNNHGFTVLKRV